MTDPARSVLDELADLLARATAHPLRREECLRCVELADQVPGRRRSVAAALAAQRSAAAVDALLCLPAHVPGVPEGLHAALARGIRRSRADGRPFPAHCSLDFRVSRARGFGALLERARVAFGHDCEPVRVAGRAGWRVNVWIAPGRAPEWPRGLGEDLAFLHGRLSRLRGTRLWLNGWCFPQDGPVTPPVQAHLLSAWIAWARGSERGGGRP